MVLPLLLASDAARSWGGSAVLGVPPMSDCRGFPHSLLHQENDWALPCHNQTGTQAASHHQSLVIH
ncbi:hypothetical protein [Moorena sp. SIO1G6]|uniref:hypothetical protein n=1 Tax=Moorena sp. SIO1G6 TaxID=2607840 RepID=UPI00257DC098|nr:hypothetical protein [Moorena sp. SIO1G6]